MWDEIILVWLIKLLLNQWKIIYVACSNRSWLKSFHKQFLNLLKENELWFENEKGEQIITYLQELPKWFRSFFKFLKTIKDLKYFFLCDSIIVWWWEILTEETPFSYWYWLLSIWPSLLIWKKLYLMWGIQIPRKLRNKIPFWILIKKAEKIYARDYELIQTNYLVSKMEFFPDTSFFVYDDVNINNYKWNNLHTEKWKYVIVNLNKKAKNFYNKIEEIVDKYYKDAYIVYFARICKSPKDDDIIYYHKLKEKYPSIKILDWENFVNFIKILSWAEKVFTTRLHLFLVSYYLWVDVQPFAYEKKVNKMKQVLWIMW